MKRAEWTGGEGCGVIIDAMKIVSSIISTSTLGNASIEALVDCGGQHQSGDDTTRERIEAMVPRVTEMRNRPSLSSASTNLESLLHMEISRSPSGLALKRI